MASFPNSDNKIINWNTMSPTSTSSVKRKNREWEEENVIQDLVQPLFASKRIKTKPREATLEELYSLSKITTDQVSSKFVVKIIFVLSQIEKRISGDGALLIRKHIRDQLANLPNDETIILGELACLLALIDKKKSVEKVVKILIKDKSAIKLLIGKISIDLLIADEVGKKIPSGLPHKFLIQIVKSIILNDGTFNPSAAALFYVLMETLGFPFNDAHRVQIKSVLYQLANHPKIPSLFLDQDSVHDSVAHLVRIDLKLAENAKLTHVDLKRAALLSTLFDLRQGHEGNCYVIGPQIILYHNHLYKCLKETLLLLSTGFFIVKGHIQVPVAPFANQKWAPTEAVGKKALIPSLALGLPSFTRIFKVLKATEMPDDLFNTNVSLEASVLIEQVCLDNGVSNPEWGNVLLGSYTQNRIQQMTLAKKEFFEVNRVGARVFVPTPTKVKTRSQRAKHRKTDLPREHFLNFFFEMMREWCQKSHPKKAGGILRTLYFLKEHLGKRLWIQDQQELEYSYDDKTFSYKNVNGEEVNMALSPQKAASLKALVKKPRRFIYLDQNDAIQYTTTLQGFSTLLKEIMIQLSVDLPNGSTQLFIDFFDSKGGGRLLANVLAEVNSRIADKTFEAKYIHSFDLPYLVQDGGYSDTLLEQIYEIKMMKKQIVSQRPLPCFKRICNFFKAQDAQTKSFLSDSHRLIFVSNTNHTFTFSPSRFSSYFMSSKKVNSTYKLRMELPAVAYMQRPLTPHFINYFFGKNFSSSKKGKRLKAEFNFTANNTITLKEFRTRLLAKISTTEKKRLFAVPFHDSVQDISGTEFATNHLTAFLNDLSQSFTLPSSRDRIIGNINIELMIGSLFISPRKLAKIISKKIAAEDGPMIDLYVIENLIRKAVGLPEIIGLGDLGWNGRSNREKAFHKDLLFGYHFGLNRTTFFIRDVEEDTMLSQEEFEKYHDLELFLPKSI